MEIDFLGLKKKGVSELLGRKPDSGGDSAMGEGGGQKWMSSIPGCSYSGSNGHLHDYSQQNVTSLGKKNYCKDINLKFSEKGVPGGVMSKCVGSSTSQPQEADAIERNNAKLTLFYADSVYVFDDVPPKKAKAILSMAEYDQYADFELPKAEVSKKAVGRLPPPSPIKDPSRFQQETLVFGTVPQARKASLFRFLEKRKHRLKGVIPFNLATNPSSSSDCSYLQRKNH